MVRNFQWHRNGIGRVMRNLQIRYHPRTESVHSISFMTFNYHAKIDVVVFKLFELHSVLVRSL